MARSSLRVKVSEIRALEARFGTQKALAEHLGVSSRYLRYLKSGERRGERISKDIHKLYGAAAREARIPLRDTRRVRDFYQREVFVREPTKAEQEARIPIFPVSTGKPGKAYMVMAKVFVPRTDISGGKARRRGRAGVWRNEYVSVKTPAEFKRDQGALREEVKKTIRKQFGVSPLEVKFFRGSQSVEREE